MTNTQTLTESRRPAGSNNLFVAWETLTNADNPDVAVSLRLLLTRLGAAVSGAHAGADVLKARREATGSTWCDES